MSTNLSAMHENSDYDPCPTVTPVRKAFLIAGCLCGVASEVCGSIAAFKHIDCDQKLRWETADFSLQTAAIAFLGIAAIWNKVKAALSSEPSSNVENYQAVPDHKV